MQIFHNEDVHMPLQMNMSLCFSILSNAHSQNRFRFALLASFKRGLTASLTRTMSFIS